MRNCWGKINTNFALFQEHDVDSNVFGEVGWKVYFKYIQTAGFGFFIGCLLQAILAQVNIVLTILTQLIYHQY